MQSLRNEKQLKQTNMNVSWPSCPSHYKFVTDLFQKPAKAWFFVL